MAGIFYLLDNPEAQKYKEYRLKPGSGKDTNPEAEKHQTERKNRSSPNQGSRFFSIAGNDLLLDLGQQGGHFCLRVFYEVLAA